MRVAALYDVHGMPRARGGSRRAGTTSTRSSSAATSSGGPQPAETIERLVRSATLALAARQLRPRARARARTRLGGRRDARCTRTWLTPGRARSCTLPPTGDARRRGLGRVLYCHATPANDIELLTRDDARRAIPADARTASTSGVVVTGHTHMQFDRRSTGCAGQRGLRRDAVRGRGGRVLGARRRRRRAPADAVRHRARRARRSSRRLARGGGLRRREPAGDRAPVAISSASRHCASLTISCRRPRRQAARRPRRVLRRAPERATERFAAGATLLVGGEPAKVVESKRGAAAGP